MYRRKNEKEKDPDKAEDFEILTICSLKLNNYFMGNGYALRAKSWRSWCVRTLDPPQLARRH